MAHPREVELEQRMALLRENNRRLKVGEPLLSDDTVIKAVEILDQTPIANQVDLQPNPDPEPQPQPESKLTSQPDLAAELAEARLSAERAEAARLKTEREVAETLRQANEARQKAEHEAEKLRREKEDLAASVITDERLREEFTPDELETFGMEQCRMILRQADKQARIQARKATESTTTETTARIDNSRAEIEQERTSLFYMMLQTAVPEWETINKDKQWLDWLTHKDPGAAESRQSLLTRARQVLNVTPVIELFNAYKATRAPAPADNRRGVLPTGRAPNGAPSSAGPKAEQITRRQIKEWTQQFTRREIGREQWSTLEQRINAAAISGNIIP
jgi:F0F1-type ATP synthase membrane subunit b/b'